MKLHEQRDVLAGAIRLVLPYLHSGPPLGAFGIAAEDCALAHIDYFGGIESSAGVLADALGQVEGTSCAEAWARYGSERQPCDCSACAGPEAAAKARERHRAAYEKVKEWSA